MEYNDLEIIKAGYMGLHDRIIPRMLSTKEELSRNRLIPSVNPIIWMVWHILRTEDMFLSNVVFRKDQVFHSGQWQDALSVETPHVGTGMTVAEANNLAKDINIDTLGEYNITVKNHSLELLSQIQDLPTDELDTADEIEKRLRSAQAFPDHILKERATAYAPTPVSVCILGVMSHGYMHFGQYLTLTKPL